MNILVLDTEHSTGAFKPWEKGFYLTCVGVVQDSDEGRSEDVLWFDHRDKEETKDAVKWIQGYVDWADVVVMHNLKHDLCIFHCWGIHFNDTPLHCTMVTDYILEGQDKKIRYDLNSVAKRYGLEQKHDVVKEKYWNRGIQTFDIPDWILGPYCIQDCHLTMDIYLRQVPRFEGKRIEKVIKLQNEYTYVLEEMERNGLEFSTEVSAEVIREHQELADGYREEILKGVPHGDKINLSSNQQLSALLYGGILKVRWKDWYIQEYKTKPYSRYYEKDFVEEVQFKGLGFTPDKRHKKKDGYYKVDKDTIRTLSAHTKKQREVKSLLVKYSVHAKVVSTLHGRKGTKGLLAKIQPDNRIHPTFNQCVTATGRLTSSNPNGQNLFPTVKVCFVPRFDGIMQVDLSQIEWRDAAWLAQDEVMIDEINSGVDQHIATVRDLMEMTFLSKSDPESKKNRTHAKVFNFRMIFGGTEWGFYLDIDMPNFSIKKWKKIIKAFWKKYFRLAKFHKDNVKFVFRNGYIEIPTGRWFKFHKMQIKEDYTYSVNQIKNYPIQGMSGGDVLPLMAVIIRRGMRKMGLDSKLILTVHDSIVFDYLEGEREKLARLCYNVGNNLGAYIQNYYGLDWNVKLECEVEAGPNYGSLKYLPPEEVGL
jgi:DNA polymerase I-like protein with 3'-5' exonuclease and polymerase domains